MNDDKKDIIKVLLTGKMERDVRNNHIIRYGVAVVAAALLLLPAVMRTEATPSAQDAWSFRAVAGLCGLAAVIAAVSVCLRKGRAAVRPHWMDGTVTLWWLYVTANYWFLSPYPARETYWEATALWMAYVALRVVASLCGAAWRRTWTCGLLAAGAYEAIAGWGQLLGLSVSHHHQYALTGTFFNPGPYGIFLASAVAVAWAAGIRLCPVGGTGGRCRLRDMFQSFRHGIPSGWMRPVALSVAVACLPLLAATWSRAAWAGLGVAAVLFLWQTGRRKLVGWGLVAAAVIGTAAYFLKQGSADGRVLMTLVAGRAWLDEWVVGHGLGGYLPAYGEVQAELFAAHPSSPLADVAGSPGYAFNALLGTGVEQGIVGMAFALVVCLGSLVFLWRRRDISAFGWAALLAASMFSYPFALWPFRLLAVGWVATAIDGCPTVAGSRGGWRDGAVAVIAVAVLGASAYGAAAMGCGAARTAEAYAGYSRLRGIQDAAFVDDFREMHDELSAYPDFLFTFGNALRETGRYNESNAVLREGTRVSCDPMFYTVMGNNYRDLGAAEEAEEAYRKAAGMLPGRLYPLYRLMKLYEAEGRRDEAYEMARRIAAIRPKVESPATRQMKNEAENFIERHEKDHER